MNNKNTSDNFFKLFTQDEIKNEKDFIIAQYGGSKDNQYKDSSLISVGVQIQGIDYFTHTNIKLELKQNFNGHHIFELIADPDEFTERNAYLLENSRQQLGKRIAFFFKQHGKIASIFIGIITQISTQKKEGIKHIVLRGKSPSILMENGLHCRSFENKTFEEIIKEVIKEYPKDLVDFEINPNYKDRLAYITQYNCSDYDFLKQLSVRFGENLHYTGDRFSFSAWGGKITELMEGEDIYDYELKMEILPQKFSYTAYDPKQSVDYTIESDSQKIQQSENPFQQFAFNISEQAFNVTPTYHYDNDLLLNRQTDLQKTVERERKKRQNLVYLEATSNNPNLRIGSVVKMMTWMPGHSIFKNGKVPAESYKIIELVHHFEDGEGYTNTFIGIPKDLSVPLDYDPTQFPKAQIQHATVTDNKDPLKMGRVRVQFLWQKPDNSQTPWIQIIQPHAGGGKGTYMNPEIGETVLVAFQGGNAESPLVLGTAYNGGEIAAYYTEGNDIKVIQTRSGTKIIFNDAEGEGSILIKDPSGNQMFMDGQGNINVNAPNNMNFTVGKNFSLNVGGDMRTNVGNNSSESIGMFKDTMIGGNASITVMGQLTEVIEGDVISEVKKGKTLYNADQGIETLSEGIIKNNAKQQIINNSGAKNTSF